MFFGIYIKKLSKKVPWESTKIEEKSSVLVHHHHPSQNNILSLVFKTYLVILLTCLIVRWKKCGFTS